MQGEWGTEKPARFFVISVFFAVVTTPLPFIPSPRAGLFSEVARLGARGEGTWAHTCERGDPDLARNPRIPRSGSQNVRLD